MIKICGLTNIKDAQLACELGAWATGFIFVEASPRFINAQQAAEIISALPDNVEKIGVFANSSIEAITKVAQIAKLTKIQLHGGESSEFCQDIKKQTGLEVIKAIRVKNKRDLGKIKDYKGKVFAILLDTYCEKELGGTGKIFDWDIAVEAKKYNVPIILAGGLNPQNIKQAKDKVSPFALDISSGIESEKGIKDPDKMVKLFNFNC